MILEFVLVAFLGGIGALGRYVFSQWNGQLPWGILVANSLASAFAAAGVAAFGANHLSAIILVAGLAGGLSTFSSVIAQTASFWQQRKFTEAAWNLALNIVVPSTVALATGLLAVALLK
jgi:CrcB protein